MKATINCIKNSQTKTKSQNAHQDYLKGRSRKERQAILEKAAAYNVAGRIVVLAYHNHFADSFGLPDGVFELVDNFYGSGVPEWNVVRLSVILVGTLAQSHFVPESLPDALRQRFEQAPIFPLGKIASPVAKGANPAADELERLVAEEDGMSDIKGTEYEAKLIRQGDAYVRNLFALKHVQKAIDRLAKHFEQTVLNDREAKKKGRKDSDEVLLFDGDEVVKLAQKYLFEALVAK